MMLTRQQQEAVAKLRKWKVGALFMEAGTGKTRAAVMLANSTTCTAVFWIAPLRTLINVQAEIANSGGLVMPAYYYGVESLSGSDRIYMELLAKVEASREPLVIVDESLKIKNADAKRTRRVLQIGRHARWKLVLNGTPISRNLMDMWPQMEFLSPRILNMTLSQFRDTFTRWKKVTKRIGSRIYTKEFVTGMDNVDYLHSLIRHYVYECDLSLSIKQKWHEVPFSLTAESRERYDSIKRNYLKDEMLEWRNNNIFFAMTTEMQMAYAIDGNKLEALRQLMAKLEHEETIIFCRFIVCQSECARLFPSALILSLQSCSFGLNLQRYKNIVFFDRVWDYALLLQASRRIFRTGQDADCNYYELTGNVGLERMIKENNSAKYSMSEYLKKITKEELYERL